MIGAPVPGVVNALQVTIPGRSPSVPSVKALGNARDEKNRKILKHMSKFVLVQALASRLNKLEAGTFFETFHFLVTAKSYNIWNFFLSKRTKIFELGA